MTLAIDGSVHGNSGGASSLGVSLTTTQANDYIVVSITTNSGPVVSVVSGVIGLLTRVGSAAVTGNPTFVMEVWAGFSPGALTADTITVTTTGSAFLTVDAFGVSGSGQTSLVFDVGGPQTGVVDPISITTASANTMVIASYRENSAASPTAGSGFTTISGANFQLTEYKVLSAGATTSCTQTTGAGTANAGVVFAIVQNTSTTGGARVVQRFNKSKLAYPAGAVPGVDRSHPASQNLVMSGYNPPGQLNYVNITNGQPFTFNNVNGTMTPSIDGIIGGAIVQNTTNSTFSSGLGLAAAPPVATWAGIFRFTSDANTNGSGISTANSGYGFNIDPGGRFTLFGGFGLPNCPFTIAVGFPYFAAASVANIAGSPTVYWLAKNLVTGQVLTGSSAASTTGTSAPTFCCIGNDSGDGGHMPIACAMYAATFLSLPQLRKWSEAPWEFWFPNKTINLTSDATVVTPPVTTGGARVSQRFNRSKLAYPAGALPGIDPSHPASKNLALSAVASGSNFIDSLRGIKANDISVLGASVDETLGPVTKYSPTISWVTFTSLSFPSTRAAVTLAGIFRSTSAFDTQSVVGVGNAFETLLFYQTDTNVVGWYDGAQHNVALNVATNQPYFLVASANTAGVNFVLKNLATGQVQSAVFTGAITLGALAATDITLGADTRLGGADSMGGSMAAAMMNLAYMPMSQLLKWAESPWEFWFPNKPINLMSDGGVIVPPPTFLAAWARQSNLPVLGTGNF